MLIVLAGKKGDMRPVVWFCPVVWVVLWTFERQMLEFFQGCLEKFWYGYVAGAYGIVPVNGESTEKGTSPVDQDGI